MGMVLKTDAAKSPWEWIADNLRDLKCDLKLAVVADGAHFRDVVRRMKAHGYHAEFGPGHAILREDGRIARIYAFDSSCAEACKCTFAALELDGAVVGADVPWDVVRLVRERIVRTKSRLDLGCYVTDERFDSGSRDAADAIAYEFLGYKFLGGTGLRSAYDALKTPDWVGVMAEWSKGFKPFGSCRPKRMSYEELAKMTLGVWSEWFSQSGGGK